MFHDRPELSDHVVDASAPTPYAPPAPPRRPGLRARTADLLDVLYQERALRRLGGHPAGSAPQPSAQPLARQSAAADEAANAPAADPSAADLATRIAAAVDTLPIACRAPVRMYLSGYSQEQVAGLLGWTAARTRDVLRPALAELRLIVASASPGGTPA